MPEVENFKGAHNGFANAGNTIVGHDVWIGNEAMIMPGVTIGDGAVIGSRSLVTKNVEPYTVVGGIRPRPLRHDSLILILKCF